MIPFPLGLLPWAILAGLIALGGMFGWGHHKGWTERDQEAQIEVAKANERARATEQRLTTQINDHATKLQEANNALDQKSSALDRAIRAGRVRLPAPSCPQPAADAAAPSGDSAEAPSESERQTLAAIAAIVADGDKAINQLNACIDQYNQIRSTK